ncbi:MAG: TIR domain-containing protein, partial [Ferruginibacter sp.]|nr:TIR domain-containing protein [Ferruginibacter sp.]
AALTNNASDEAYIKGKLKERFATACQVIVIIGESTKNLYRYVRWELEVAQNLNLPIIAVNLNGDRKQNIDTCPPIIKDTYAVHIPFKMKIIKYALDQFPTEFKNKTSNLSAGGRTYNDSVYQSLGLN